MSCVSWDEAHAFCAWLSKKEKKKGLSYRLPYDAEWSAAVGDTVFPWGNKWPGSARDANYFSREMELEYPGYGGATDSSDEHTRTAPVASFRANASGFYDLGGNLWEWCENAYRNTMNPPEILAAYQLLRWEVHRDGKPYRVLRGAAWSNRGTKMLRSAFHNCNHPTYRSNFYGFRIVVVETPGGR